MKGEYTSQTTGPSMPPPVHVRVEKGKAKKINYCFTEPFRIGRTPSCEVQITDRMVSRFHAEVLFVGDQWWAYDLESGNGTYVNRKRVERAPLGRETRISLGIDGPILSLTTQEIAEAQGPPPDHSVTHYMEHYLTDSGDEDVGHRTMMIRRAFERAQKKQKKNIPGSLRLLQVYSWQQVPMPHLNTWRFGNSVYWQQTSFMP